VLLASFRVTSEEGLVQQGGTGAVDNRDHDFAASSIVARMNALMLNSRR
jgi:hypothetical protein